MDYKKQIVTDLHEVLGDHLTYDELYNLVEIPKLSTNGDYSFPTFPLAKKYRKAPHLIAKEVADELEGSNYESVSIKGGYINFFLKKDLISQNVLKTILAEKENYGDSTEGDNGNVPIDLSSPNIAKPISMGHLRSTVIGNSLAEIYSKRGYVPIKINYIGDWGTQFGKLIVAYRLWGNEEKVKSDPIHELLKLYVHFHTKAETKPELEEAGREAFKKLEDGDEDAVALWKWFRSESLREFQRIYDMLDITFDSYNGESFYNDKMDRVINMLEEKNLLKSDKGADIVDLSAYDLNPALIRKSDGATLYLTRDLASAFYRIETYNFVQALYVVGNEQAIHFKQLKAVLNELGCDWAENIHHIPFGLITQGGEKLSTRQGKVVLLEEVLNEAISSVRKQIEKKNPSLKNKDEVAHQVGIGAVIFHDLKNDRLNSIDFDLSEIIQFEGETGPYVQYTRSRCESILSKANWTGPATNASLELNDADSWEIIKSLNNFPCKVKEAAIKYEPSIIAKYLIDLSQKFNKYYSKTKILVDDEQKEARLALISSVSVVIKEGLRLLGIKAPNKM